MPGVLVYSLLLVCVLPIQRGTRGCGCSGHPAFPTPSKGGREIFAELGRIVSRGRERAFGTGRLKFELRTRATNSASSRTSAARSGTHNHRCPCYARLGLQFHPTANIGGYGSRPSPGRRKSPNGLSVIAEVRQRTNPCFPRDEMDCFAEHFIRRAFARRGGSP
jgi:hypothetical protein